jgi:hypothetical protein
VTDTRPASYKQIRFINRMLRARGAYAAQLPTRRSILTVSEASQIIQALRPEWLEHRRRTRRPKVKKDHSPHSTTHRLKPLRHNGRLPEFRTLEEEAEYWRLERERQRRLEEKKHTDPKQPTYNFEWNNRDWKQGLRPPTKALRRALREEGLDPDHFLTSKDAVKALRKQRYRPTPPVG